MQLQSIALLVCTATCLDVPQIQLKTIILPPDPLPIDDPRPERYRVVVPNYRVTQDFNLRVTQDGFPRVTEGLVENG